MNSEFFEIVSNNSKIYKVISPIENRITSETLIASKKQNILAILDLLIKTEPRCITIYGVKSKYDFYDDKFILNFLNNDTDKLVYDCIVDCVSTVILEESYVIITINSKAINPISIYNELKDKFKNY